MRDYLMIDCTPSEESCAQLGADNYSTQAKAEARRFIAQIEKHYPLPDKAELGYLTISPQSHDFGTYYQVKIVFDDECELSVNWAYSIEADELGALRVWDETELA
jgi:hypothetical protein